MKKIRCDWLESEYVLQCFGSLEGPARKAYLVFLEEEMGIDREKEFSGGGLLRSHVGWDQVQSMRKKGTRVLSDERILGSDSFVRDVLKDAEDRMALPLSSDERMRRIIGDIEEVCHDAGITEAFLRSGSRSGELASMRKSLAMRFVYEYGLSMAETGRRLGVTTNAVSYMVRSR